MGFSSETSEKALAACGRHCSICHKFCGSHMELHHIKQVADGGDDTYDNCIPLCFDCHADVKAYNPKHPKGRQYTESELKRHRDSWYSKISSGEVASQQDTKVSTKSKTNKNIPTLKYTVVKEQMPEDISEQYFIDEYPDLVSNCRKIKRTIGNFEWKIICAVLELTDYGVSWKNITISDLLFHLEVSMNNIEDELSNLARLGYLSLDEDDEVKLRGKATLIVDLADKVSTKLDPDKYPEDMFYTIMQKLIE